MPSPPAIPKEEPAEREDVAFLVPFLGVVLLLPPLLNLFEDLRTPYGVPVEVLYLFGVWLLIIAAAVLLSRRRPFRETTPAAEADQPSRPAPSPPDRA